MSIGLRPAKTNARKAKRVPLTCRLFFFGENDFEGEARLVDLSTSGCRAESQVPVQVGMEFRLSLFLPDYQWPLRVERAVVRWVDGVTIALEFLTLRPAQRDRLITLTIMSKSTTL